jgi:hypothetical protein
MSIASSRKVGYGEVARLLAIRGRPGNVLLACPEDQELIFRYKNRDRPKCLFSNTNLGRGNRFGTNCGLNCLD